MGSNEKEFKVTLKNDTFFANALYGLSNVSHASTDGSETQDYRESPHAIQKHVALLDSISLLLVFRPSGDVTATGMLQEGNQVTIYWAKNDRNPLTADEDNYVQQLEKAFRESESTAEPIRIVIRMCKRKILSRIKKLVKVLHSQSTNFFGLSSSDGYAEDFRKYLVRTGVIADKPLIKVLDLLVEAAARLTVYSSDKDIQQVVVCASYLVRIPDMNLGGIPGINPYHFYKLRKVGDYYSACLLIVKTLANNPIIKKNFLLEQVKPPPIKSITVYGETVRALNTFLLYYNVTPISSFEDLKKVYRNTIPGIQGNKEIKSTQHCELTVALALWEKRQKQGIAGALEVGCSKASCYYCSVFVRRFNEWAKRQPQVNQIVTSGYHAKYVNGWLMPTYPSEVVDQVLDHVGNLVYDVFNCVTGPRRKSDSRSLSDIIYEPFSKDDPMEDQAPMETLDEAN
ncbi:MAG: hypothetical protein Q9196_000883 [Gyalolechia fulgens]